jgi:hypothetical protein
MTGEAAICELRALAFSFVLREHLRVRFGRHWWNVPKAADDLIDLWSTASQYSVEELAISLSGSELSFDMLAEAVNVASPGA